LGDSLPVDIKGERVLFFFGAASTGGKPHRLIHSATDGVAIDAYFVYPEELKTVARVQVFRDFVVSKAQRWPS